MRSKVSNFSLQGFRIFSEAKNKLGEGRLGIGSICEKRASRFNPLLAGEGGVIATAGGGSGRLGRESFLSFTHTNHPWPNVYCSVR